MALRRSDLQPAQLAKVVARVTAIGPFENFLLQAELDGSEGRFRAPLHQCLLEAKNDYEAIAAWLASKHDPNGTGKTAIHRAYRKEAERLLLWAILEHGKPLSSLTVEGRELVQVVPCRSASALVRATPSPALVAALAAARGAAQLVGAALFDGHPAQPVYLPGQP